MIYINRIHSNKGTVENKVRTGGLKLNMNIKMFSMVFILCGAMELSIIPRVQATWPPETVLEDEQNAVSTSTKLNSIKNRQEIVDKLAADERQLETLLGKLKKDEEELSDLQKKYEGQIIQNNSKKNSSPSK